MISIRDLEKGIKDIKNRINCISCPTERNCCIFSDDFGHSLYKEEAEIILEKDFVRYLLNEQLKATERGEYTLRVRCPRLTKELRCSLHSKKEELNLDGCINFPIWLDCEPYADGNPYTIIIDYRCFEIEKRWDEFSNIIIKLSKEYQTPTSVNYMEDKKKPWGLDINEFNEVRKNGKIIKQFLRPIKY